jgi:hypothetical protein
MRSLRQIKKLISHAGVKSKPEADQAVLRHLLAELAAVAGDAPSPHENETLSAADLLTVACLNAAFRRGGLEASSGYAIWWHRGRISAPRGWSKS